VTLTIGHYGRTASIYNLLSQAGRFGLSAEEARGEIDRLVDVVRHWRDGFFACGTSTTSPRPSCLTASSSKSNRARKSLSRVHLRQATHSFCADVGIRRSSTRTVPDLIDFQKVQLPQLPACSSAESEPIPGGMLQ